MTDDIFTQEDETFSRSLVEARDWASTVQFKAEGGILNGSISQPEESAVLTPEALKQALEAIHNWHFTAELVPCYYRVRVWCTDCFAIDPGGCFDGVDFIDPEHYNSIEKAVAAGDEWVEGCTLYQYEIIDPFGKVVNIDE
jgi:hypothetical protein